MNALLPDLVSGQLSLVVLPRGSERMLLELVARVARGVPLRVLDGGNCFNAYIVARELARHTPDVDHILNVEAGLKRIQVARAFTCYQVLSLLEGTPADGRPTLVLNVLDTFYDESVALVERRRLLDGSIRELRRLCRQSSVGVSARWPKVDLPETQVLLQALEHAAGRVWRMEPEKEPAALRLF